MRGLMMDFQLTIPTLLERARNEFNRVEVVWRCPDKSVARYTFANLYQRSRALAEALTRAGMKKGDRIATLMWNHDTQSGSVSRRSFSRRSFAYIESSIACFRVGVHRQPRGRSIFDRG